MHHRSRSPRSYLAGRTPVLALLAGCLALGAAALDAPGARAESEPVVLFGGGVPGTSVRRVVDETVQQSMTIEAPPEILKNYTERGITFPVRVSVRRNSVYLEKYGAESDAGDLPFSIRWLDGTTRITAADGTELPVPEALAAGYAVEAVNQSDGKTTITDITGPGEVSEQMRAALADTFTQLSSTLFKYYEPVEVGESFVAKTPAKIPVPDMPPMELVATRHYTLRSVEDGIAHFSFTSEAHADVERGAMKFFIETKGDGELEFDIEDKLIVKTVERAKGKSGFGMQGTRQIVEQDIVMTVTGELAD